MIWIQNFEWKKNLIWSINWDGILLTPCTFFYPFNCLPIAVPFQSNKVATPLISIDNRTEKKNFLMSANQIPRPLFCVSKGTYKCRFLPWISQIATKPTKPLLFGGFWKILFFEDDWLKFLQFIENEEF